MCEMTERKQLWMKSLYLWRSKKKKSLIKYERLLLIQIPLKLFFHYSYRSWNSYNYSLQVWDKTIPLVADEENPQLNIIQLFELKEIITVLYYCALSYCLIQCFTTFFFFSFYFSKKSWTPSNAQPPTKRSTRQVWWLCFLMSSHLLGCL